MKGFARAFGGINILFVGDLWQIDPPSGGFLASIPVEYIRRARLLAGVSVWIVLQTC